MKSPTPSLLPLLRSRTQGEIAAWIVLHPTEAFSLTQIAERVGTSPPTVTREVDRLAAAGLVRTTRAGNQRLVQVETENVVYKPLSDLLAVTFGPRAVLKEALERIPGVERAFIYGSWAARYSQEPGNPPGDIDVIAVGNSEREAIYEATDTAERALRREVNIRPMTQEDWDSAIAANNPLLQTILTRPTITLIGEPVQPTCEPRDNTAAAPRLD